MMRKPLEVEEALPAGRHLLLDLGVEAPVLAQQAAERLHDRHVADDVRHLAVDRRGAIGKLVVQRPAGGGAAEHDDHDEPGDDHQARRHAPAHGRDEARWRRPSPGTAAARSTPACSRR